MATAQLMGAATNRILVGTWIANIYLRHSYVCAQGAALIADATGGRFILGLGVSHQPVNGALGIDMQDPPKVLRRYVTAVRGWLKGEGPPTHLPQRPAAHHVPVYVAALTSHTVELASELADGIMPFLWAGARVNESKAWIARGRSKAAGLGKLDVTLGLPTFIGDDLEAMRAAARQNLGLYTTFPFFQRLFRASGFTSEVAQMEKGAGGASLSDRLLDAVCLLGPAAVAGNSSQRFASPASTSRSWFPLSGSKGHERSFRHSGGRHQRRTTSRDTMVQSTGHACRMRQLATDQPPC